MVVKGRGGKKGGQLGSLGKKIKIGLREVRQCCLQFFDSRIITSLSSLAYSFCKGTELQRSDPVDRKHITTPSAHWSPLKRGGLRTGIKRKKDKDKAAELLLRKTGNDGQFRRKKNSGLEPDFGRNQSEPKLFGPFKFYKVPKLRTLFLSTN